MKMQILSVAEARKILGKVSERMTDEEIENTIETLDLLAIQALKKAKENRYDKE